MIRSAIASVPLVETLEQMKDHLSSLRSESFDGSNGFEHVVVGDFANRFPRDEIRHGASPCCSNVGFLPMELKIWLLASFPYI